MTSANASDRGSARNRGASGSPSTPRSRHTAFRTASGSKGGIAAVHSTGDLEEQLRQRLRIKSVIWAVASAALGATAMIAHWNDEVDKVSGAVITPGIRLHPLTAFSASPLPGVLFLCSAATLVIIGLLSPKRELGLKRLRLIEWFGVAEIAGFFMLNQINSLPKHLSQMGDLPMEIGIAGAGPWSALIVAFGVLIPSSLRHGAIRTGVILACAFVPDVLLIAQLGAAPKGFATYLVLKAILAIAMSTFAVFGAYRIDVLAQDAQQARQLGQYLLGDRLGSGGMGEVHLAEHQFLRRPCAVKLIRSEQAGDAATLARFEREVQAAAGLTHPNTVQIYDYGHDEAGTFYFAMEYLPGMSLDELVTRHGPLPPARAIRVLRQLCGALGEAHDAGLIHRDLKPGNVMLCERGGAHDVAKLLDFGLVADHNAGAPTDSSKLTQTGMIMGTPAFMSPEQCGGDGVVTPTSDLYGIGALAYYLLTGVVPFAGRSPMKMLAAHLYETPASITELRPDISPELAAVIAKCLEKSPANRFTDARALERALAACAGEEWTEGQARAWWLEQHRAAGATPPSAESGPA